VKYIALTGQIAAGKTAVAQALVARGYLLISYTDLLKQYVARALTAIGQPTTVEMILADKEHYRALIQEFGSVIGFDQGGAFVAEALAEWERLGWPLAVFDNVRTDAQAASVQAYGFEVVELRATDYTRFTRLGSAGKDPYAVFTRAAHPIERGLSETVVDLEIITDISTPEMIADFLAEYTPFDAVQPEENEPVAFLDDEAERLYYAFEGHPDDAQSNAAGAESAHE
jgi:hypothetical protein